MADSDSQETVSSATRRWKADDSLPGSFGFWLFKQIGKLLLLTPPILSILAATNGTVILFKSNGINAYLSRHMLVITIFILIGLSIVTTILFYLLSRRQKEIKAGKETEREFRLMALRNADCDKVIIESLASRINGNEEDVQRIIRLTTRNILQVLNQSSNVFADATGITCSTSIRFVNADEITCGIISKTVMRDEESYAMRGMSEDMSTLVRENTANIEVIENGQRYFASNDLIKLRNEGKYFNSRKNWDKDYTSTLVYGVPDLDLIYPLPNLLEDIGLHTDKGPVRCVGLFCIDSKGGKLDTLTCINYAQEISWRLAVLLFALRRLGSNNLRLENHSDDKADKRTGTSN